MTNKFRYYQQEANNLICDNLLHNDKCIIKMFCGTGKSLLIRKCDIISNKKLVVFVFPSLSLIEQFYDTYLCDFQKKNILKISSETQSTTNPIKIQKFLSKPSKKFICITYQSYNVLIENLNDKKIDICIYDEAHHAVGQTYQKLIFENNYCLKQIFYTATPKNSNGIVMYSKEKNAINMCGDLVYDYSYLRGSLEGYLNPFDLMIDLYTENTNKSIYEAIARCILTTKNNRVLTFHSDVNTDRDTSVINFVDNSNFETIFNNIQQKEFPEMFQYFKKINIIPLDASINMKTRKQILEDFDNTSNEDIFIICSCETIGEGIDTKNANMCVFVDPKTSYVKIIQNIGRIVRKIFNENKPNSSVVIPCYVDKTKYECCKDDPDKCDEIIRQEMKSDNGDFNDVLNVISALKQEDEDLYDLLLNYSNKYSFQEIETNLKNQNYEILENDDLNGDLLLSLEYLLNENENEKNIELDFENYEDCDNDEEIIEMVAEENNVCIEIHSNSLENPIKSYNRENKENGIIRLFKNDENEDNEDEGLYKCIIRKNNLKRINKDAIHSPNKNNKFKLNIHSNSDIQVLWNIKNDLDLIDKFSSCVIDCQVIDKWLENFENLKSFIDLNKKRPSSKSKKEEEKKNGIWLVRQKKIYKNNEGVMKDEDKRQIWEEFIENYQKYLMNDEEKWYNNFENLKSFIDLHKKRPNSRSKIIKESFLAKWLNDQNQSYKKNRRQMKDEDKKKLWEEFIENYQKYLKDNQEKWNDSFEKLKSFINLHKKRPNSNSKNREEKKISCWLIANTSNYKNNQKAMKDEDKRTLWKDFIEEYNEYLMDDDEKWIDSFEKLKSFIDLHKKLPSINKEEEKYLYSWISTQKQNYKNNKSAMEDEDKRTLWKNFMEEYNEYLMDGNEKWNDSFEKLKSFIDLHKKRPNRSKNEEQKYLAKWIVTQNQSYKHNKFAMKDEDKRTLWKYFIEEYNEYFISDQEKWYNNLKNVKEFIYLYKKIPISRSKIEDEKYLGKWLDHQKQNYKNNKFAMKHQDKRQIWKEFLEEYKEYLNNNNSEENETITISISETSSIKEEEIDEESDEEEEIIIKVKKPVIKNMDLNKGSILKSSTTNSKKSKNKKERVKTEISILHQRYKTLTSNNLHNEFKNNEDLWVSYHKIAEENEKTFPENKIPRNKIIEELEKIKTKRTKKVIDMGCGKAYISKHFENDIRFNFINYDHVSINDKIISCDISKLPLEDDSIEICILCLSMWGSNCKEYIKEAERVLESNGKLYIIEPTKRWSNRDENGIIIEEGKKLKELLEENRFQIMKEEINKFVLFECIKI